MHHCHPCSQHTVPLIMATPGETVQLVKIRGGRRMRKRLADLGLNIGMSLRIVQRTPHGPMLLAFKYDARLALKRNSRLKIKLDIITDRPCTHTDANDPIVLAADWATRIITGKTPTYGGVPGATDGTYLWSKKNIPIVTMGAGDREVPHQVNEWVGIDQLIETTKIYALTALWYLYPKDHP